MPYICCLPFLFIILLLLPDVCSFFLFFLFFSFHCKHRAAPPPRPVAFIYASTPYAATMLFKRATRHMRPPDATAPIYYAFDAHSRHTPMMPSISPPPRAPAWRSTFIDAAIPVPPFSHFISFDFFVTSIIDADDIFRLSPIITTSFSLSVRPASPLLISIFFIFPHFHHIDIAFNIIYIIYTSIYTMPISPPHYAAAARDIPAVEPFSYITCRSPFHAAFIDIIASADVYIFSFSYHDILPPYFFSFTTYYMCDDII